jgi:hypothetical protein
MGAPMPILRGVTVAITTSLLMGCGSIQRAYWDAKVEELCRKDGGVTVYERVRINSAEYKTLGGFGGGSTVYPRSTAKPDALYVADNTTTWLNESPPVRRSETRIVRKSDGKVLSKLVHFGRGGGGGFAPPPFSCQDVGISEDVVGQTFEVTGE